MLENYNQEYSRMSFFNLKKRLSDDHIIYLSAQDSSNIQHLFFCIFMSKLGNQYLKPHQLFILSKVNWSNVK